VNIQAYADYACQDSDRSWKRLGNTGAQKAGSSIEDSHIPLVCRPTVPPNMDDPGHESNHNHCPGIYCCGIVKWRLCYYAEEMAVRTCMAPDVSDRVRRVCPIACRRHTSVDIAEGQVRADAPERPVYRGQNMGCVYYIPGLHACRIAPP